MRHHLAGDHQTQYQRGFSMVELMVSLVIGLFIAAAVITLAINTSRTHDELAKISRQVENGRYAMQMLSEQLQHAGYYGRYSPEDIAPPASMPDACSQDINAIRAGIVLPIQAHTASDRPACIAAADHAANTDILVVRRVNTVPVVTCTNPGDDAWTTLSNPPRYYLQSRPGSFVLDTGDSADFTLQERSQTIANSFCRAQINRYHTDIYYISPTTSATTICPHMDAVQARPVPTLMRFSATGNRCSIPLVEGIERIQYDFGIDNQSSDGVPNTYVQMPTTMQDWLDVVTVRINLLARNDEASPGHEDKKTFTMSTHTAAPEVGPFNDDFRRRLFATSVRLINPAGRRE